MASTAPTLIPKKNLMKALIKGSNLKLLKPKEA